MDHFSPHLGTTFEGYYSKFRLPSSASIALIVSAVPAAARKSTTHDELVKSRPFMISFTYVSADSKEYYQKEYWPEKFDIELKGEKGKDGFRIRWDQGEFGWDAPSEEEGRHDTVWWKVHTDEIQFEGKTKPTSLEGEGEGADPSSSRIPWNPNDPNSTPAGIIARAPLPIQWHVHSLDSPCDFTLNLSTSSNELQVHTQDQNGSARVHIEKNWAISFPTSYIWIQTRNHHPSKGDSGLCVAGGSLIPGVDAFLVGYTTPNRFLSYAPPTSTSIFGISLGVTREIRYDKGLVELDLKGWWRRLKIVATCPQDTFFHFSAPLNTGHAPDYCAQSFAATVKVEVEERTWPWQAWTKVDEEVFEKGSLEFGGAYYKSHKD
ncbi:hypothetical protein CI109_100017 [Kwoniella shandongensis]|uniref:Uncharacterized protein n=1 Tax=Kwoniella shandongensis TaxID=1734106 RepID=A0A5M6BUL1_9TREE|nr:uncharacterized protein CI109_006010 [Kwoniella shandongensis]KAA5525702.1 hypothetical protein CI109_006010 [Kwoniella shandongensis]